MSVSTEPPATVNLTYELTVSSLREYPEYALYTEKNTGEIRVYNKKRGRFLNTGRQGAYQTVSLGNVVGRKSISLHRVIASELIENPNNLPCVDHINGKHTDNRLWNLRWVSHSENAHNIRKAKGYQQNGSVWVACITRNRTRIGLGSFKTPEEARAAYLAASRKYYPGIKPEATE